MSDFYGRVRAFERVTKSLGEIHFNAVANKKSFAVKVGEKINIVETPDEESAKKIADALNETIAKTKAEFDDVLAALELKFAETDLFSGQRKFEK